MHENSATTVDVWTKYTIPLTPVKRASATSGESASMRVGNILSNSNRAPPGDIWEYADALVKDTAVSQAGPTDEGSGAVVFKAVKKLVYDHFKVVFKDVKAESLDGETEGYRVEVGSRVEDTTDDSGL